MRMGSECAGDVRASKAVALLCGRELWVGI